jgi:hypothetical protein
MYPRNVGGFSPVYTALFSRRQNSPVTAVRNSERIQMFWFNQLSGRTHVDRSLVRANRNTGQGNVIKTVLL